MNLMNLTAKQKQVFESKIRKLNDSFDEASFEALFEEISDLLNTILASEIESWLLDLAEREQGKLPLIWGILTWWCLTIGDFEGVLENAPKATKHFPQTELWQDFEETARNLALAESENGQET
jgi:hypothetical protein